eukprot:GHVS01075524.1.p1 GENE.GHVS01075524.1~~GHVS01075524.1.p1  ORF type:complete len:1134 (+),score=188.64 GHVS01075524.1:168-3569(+)
MALLKRRFPVRLLGSSSSSSCHSSSLRHCHTSLASSHHFLSSSAYSSGPPPPSTLLALSPPPSISSLNHSHRHPLAASFSSSSCGDEGPNSTGGRGRLVGHLGDSTFFGAVEENSRPMNEKYAAQFEKVKRVLMERNAFSKDIVEREALTFYTQLGLNEYYFQTASPQTIANNLGCVLAAKILHETSHSDFFPLIHQESEGEVFWMARASLLNRKASQNYQVEKAMEEKYLGFDGKLPINWRMQCYRSSGSIFSDTGSNFESLRTYFLQKPEYPIPVSEVDKSESDLSKVLDVYFFAHKKGTATEEIYGSLNNQAVGDTTEQDIFFNVAPRGTGYRIDCAFRRGEHNRNFFSRLGDCVTMWGLFSQRKYSEPLSNGVHIVTIFVEELPAKAELNQPELSIDQRVHRLLKAIRMQYIMPLSRFTELAQDRKLTVHEAAYAFSACKFVFHFSGTVGPAFSKISEVLGGSDSVSPQELNEVRTRLKVPPYSEDTVAHAVEENVDIMKRLYKEFQDMHHPRAYKERGNKICEWVEDTELARDIQRIEKPDMAPIFQWFRLFNKSIVRTNFWKERKLCVSCRLDPAFLPAEDYPDRPYAILFAVGSEFHGFHVRFADVSRGGIRVVQSFSDQGYEHNRQHAFDECYKLAHTQNFKNKDIPEGGSKGVILLNKTETVQVAAMRTPLAFKRYIDGFLDTLLPDDRVVDRLGKAEVCFLGPDEHTGTGGLMDWGAEHARRRGAWFWKAFTTGKAPSRGGIPHDTFGMTTSSVETYIRGIIWKLGLDEKKVTKFQTGGPDGDLGANALLKSDCLTTSLVDGSGVLHDPNGLDRSELRRLANRRFEGLKTSAMEFDASKLSSGGFKVPVSGKDVQLPDGTIVASGFKFRNEYHLDPSSSADLFNPCGGRPESISSGNVSKLFDDKERPRFKYIVEGANVFITNDARRVLEKAGVILFKDASTNKGGVTSSSLEVLAALAMTDTEFAEHMMVEDINKPPPFYTQYVSEVQQKIEENAKLEFLALWSEGNRTGKPRCDLTDMLSAKILQMNNQVLASPTVWQDQELVEAALTSAIPKALVPGIMSLETLKERVPESYLKAIFSSFLSARFYYEYGWNSSPFVLFDYFQKVKSHGQIHNEEHDTTM